MASNNILSLVLANLGGLCALLVLMLPLRCNHARRKVAGYTLVTCLTWVVTGFFLALHHLLGDKYLPRVIQAEAISLAGLYGYAQALLFKEKPSYIRSIVKVVILLSVSAGLQAGIVLSVRRYIPPGHVAQEAIVKAIGALHTISMVSGAVASRLGGSDLREPSEMHFAAIVLSSIAAVLSMVSAILVRPQNLWQTAIYGCRAISWLITGLIQFNKAIPETWEPRIDAPSAIAEAVVSVVQPAVPPVTHKSKFEPAPAVTMTTAATAIAQVSSAIGTQLHPLDGVAGLA